MMGLIIILKYMSELISVVFLLSVKCKILYLKVVYLQLECHSLLAKCHKNVLYVMFLQNALLTYLSVLNKLKKPKHAGVKQTENETSEYFIYKYLRAQSNGMQSKLKQAYEV